MADQKEELSEVRRLLAKYAMDAIALVKDASMPLDESCEILYILQELKRDASLAIDELEGLIAEQMTENIFFLPSGQQVERRTGADRKSWNHKGLAEIVADRVYQSSVDMETGEVLLSPKEMMTKMLDYAAPSYWRIKELDKIGISADAYCEKLEGKTSVIITRTKD